MSSITIKGYNDPKIPRDELFAEFIGKSWNRLSFSHIASNQVVFDTIMSIYRSNKEHLYDVKLTVPLDHPKFSESEKFYIVPGAKHLINDNSITYNYMGFGTIKYFNYLNP